MPVTVHGDLRRITQSDFSPIAYRTMGQIFAVRNEMGRFFDEPIYRDAVARRLNDPQVEVRIEVRFDRFEKHAQRLLHHTTLDGICWINISREAVTFASLRR